MAKGHYGTDSELIREALREKQMRTAEIEIIRTKLLAGEESGFSNLTAKQILAKSKEKLKSSNEL